MESLKNYFKTFNYNKEKTMAMLCNILECVIVFGATYFLKDILAEWGVNESFLPNVRLLFTTITFCSIGQCLAATEDKRYNDLLDSYEEHDVSAYISIIIAFIILMFVQPVESFMSYCIFMLLGLLSVSVLTDYKMHELPDTISFVFFIIILTMLTVYLPNTIWDSLLRAVILTIVYTVMSYIGGLGFGDVKLLFPISMVLTWSRLADFWLISIGCALIHLIPRVILSLVKRESLKGIKIAFGPYIIIGFFVTFLFI